MFSCCALFSAEEGGVDTEHLKELDEIDTATQDAPLSLSIETDGNATSRSLGDTPLSWSPRTIAAQRRTEEVAAFAELTQHILAETVKDESISPSQEHAGPEMGPGEEEDVVRTSETEGREEAEAKAEAGAEADAEVVLVKEEASATPQVEVAVTMEEADQTLRALQEAEEAANAATEEAERRRVEEEASAQAAREAESEALKAEWLAEEAKKAKVEANHRAIEDRAATQREVEEEEEAEVARREAEAAAAEEAKRYVIGSLASEKGLRLQKHGRNARTTTKTLHSGDESFQTITWGRTVYDLTKMQEVRIGTDPDPAHPGFTGTQDLRRSKRAQGAMDRSFSLLFPERSLDFTADSKKECEQLVAGFRALGAVHRG